MWLKVVAQGDDTLRLEWGDGKGQQGPTYWIGRETLREVSKEVKERLCQLVQWSRGGIESELPRLLRQLASSGERLRHVIFSPLQDQNPVDLTDLKQLIRDRYQSGDTELTITADPKMHVPWGLVYEGDPGTLSNSATGPDELAGFWSIRYTLAAVFSACKLSPTKLRRQRKSFRILSLLNRHEHDFAEHDLGDAYPHYEALIALPVGKAFNREAGEDRINAASRMDTVFHFFGHCRGGRLDLGDDQPLIRLGSK